MRANLPPRIRRLVKSLLVAAFLGLALGYAIFAAVFPNVSAPASGESSFLFIFGILLTAGLVAGLVTEDLPSCVTQSVLAIPLGILTAFAIAISPVLTGFLEVRMEDLFAFTLYLGVPVYLIAVMLYQVASLAGFFVRERLGLRSASYLRGHAAVHRK